MHRKVERAPVHGQEGAAAEQRQRLERVLGPENALKALALLGGGAFLPVHWGTFNLAMHAWDQPAETLLELGPRAGARLVMPRLGEPIEPTRAQRVEPW